MNWTEEDLQRALARGVEIVGNHEPARPTGAKLSALEDLVEQIELSGLPSPGREFRFHKTRRWRFDLYWTKERVACEIEGGIWMRTSTGFSKGHAHPKRFESDCHKYNEAAILGWLVIRVTPKMIRAGEAIAHVRRALEIRSSG